MSICVIIPARVKSRRIPKKPLVKISKKDFLLLRTFKKIIKKFSKEDVYITTDSKKVLVSMNPYSKNVILINRNCLNGTERCSYALEKIKKKYKYCLIISCDMPFLNNKIFSFFRKKVKSLKNFDGITVHAKITNPKILFNNSVAKIVLKKNKLIDLISRKKIKKNNKKNFTHHGLMLLKRKVLLDYKTIANTPLQLKEDNEWLKLIENEYRIFSFLNHSIKPEINTKDDLKNYFPVKYKNYKSIKKIEYI
jgi:3-deoxy-manno-octulosonate cytidylyltransferase (CMP-KDO synthetase)